MLNVVAHGNLTKDPETRTTKTGSTMTNFTLACRTGKKDDNNNQITEFVQVTAFGAMGDSVARYLKKGSGAVVIGQGSIQTYLRQDQTPGASLQITANAIDFAGGGGGGNQQGGQRQQSKKQEFVKVDPQDEDLPF